MNKRTGIEEWATHNTCPHVNTSEDRMVDHIARASKESRTESDHQYDKPIAEWAGSRRVVRGKSTDMDNADRTLHLTKLDDELSDREVCRVLAQYGKLLTVKFERHTSVHPDSEETGIDGKKRDRIPGKRTGVANVLFEKKESVDLAIEGLKGVPYVKGSTRLWNPQRGKYSMVELKSEREAAQASDGNRRFLSMIWHTGTANYGDWMTPWKKGGMPSYPMYSKLREAHEARQQELKEKVDGGTADYYEQKEWQNIKDNRY